MKRKEYLTPMVNAIKLQQRQTLLNTRVTGSLGDPLEPNAEEWSTRKLDDLFEY